MINQICSLSIVKRAAIASLCASITLASVGFAQVQQVPTMDGGAHSEATSTSCFTHTPLTPGSARTVCLGDEIAMLTPRRVASGFATGRVTHVNSDGDITIEIPGHGSVVRNFRTSNRDLRTAFECDDGAFRSTADERWWMHTERPMFCRGDNVIYLDLPAIHSRLRPWDIAAQSESGNWYPLIGGFIYRERGHYSYSHLNYMNDHLRQGRIVAVFRNPFGYEAERLIWENIDTVIVGQIHNGQNILASMGDAPYSVHRRASRSTTDWYNTDRDAGRYGHTEDAALYLIENADGSRVLTYYILEARRPMLAPPQEARPIQNW